MSFNYFQPFSKMVLSTRFDGPAVTFPFCLLIHSVKSFHSLLSDINLCKQISDPRPAHSVKKWRPRRSGDRRRRSNPFYLRKRSRQGVNSTDRKFTWQLILLIAAVLTIQSNTAHTIRKVKFLSKNSFSWVFHQIFFCNFSREIKVVNS